VRSPCGGDVRRARSGSGLPTLVKQINNGNWLPQVDAQSLVHDLYYQAIQAYITTLPVLNIVGNKGALKPRSA
jgi:hypothetical protein